MSITNLIDRPTQRIPAEVADRIFGEILSAMGGYALLKESLGIAPSHLCRGEKGEFIMHFNDFDKASKVKITLEGVYSYTMTFYKFSLAPENRGCQVVKRFENIYQSHLQHYFEEFVGLSLTPKFAPSY